MYGTNTTSSLALEPSNAPFHLNPPNYMHFIVSHNYI